MNPGRAPIPSAAAARRPAPVSAAPDAASGDPALVVRTGALGDMVMALPWMRFLARRHGAPVVAWAHGPWCAALYAGIDYIAAVGHIGAWRLPYWCSAAQRRAVAKARGAGVGHAYLLPGGQGAKGAKCFRLAERAGVPAGRIRRGLPEWRDPECVPPALRPDETDAAPPRLAVRGEEGEAVRARLAAAFGWRGAPVVLVHPGSSRTARLRHRAAGADRHEKWWPPDRWLSVIAGIRRHRPEALVILTGTAPERAFTTRLAEAAGGAVARVHSWAGALALRELLALQSLAASTIAVDTGPAHTAAAVGCPTTVLFDHNDPRFKCCPLGWGPVAAIRGFDADDPEPDPSPDRGIRRIRPETVLEAWRTLPARPAEPPVRWAAVFHREERTRPAPAAVRG